MWGVGDNEAAETIHGYLRNDYKRLKELWNERVEGSVPTSLGRHIGWGKANDVEDILGHDLPSSASIWMNFCLRPPSKQGMRGSFICSTQPSWAAATTISGMGIFVRCSKFHSSRF